MKVDLKDSGITSNCTDKGQKYFGSFANYLSLKVRLIISFVCSVTVKNEILVNGCLNMRMKTLSTSRNLISFIFIRFKGHTNHISVDQVCKAKKLFLNS